MLAVIDPRAARTRRSRERRKLRLIAEGSASGAPELQVVILNISQSGLLIETNAALTVGELLEVEVPQAGTSEAEVVWNAGMRFGCQFTTPISKAALSAAELLSPPNHGTPTASETVAHRQPSGSARIVFCFYTALASSAAVLIVAGMRIVANELPPFHLL